MAKKPKLGRPTRLLAASTERITVRCSKRERKSWEAAAGTLALGDWMRDTLNAAAGAAL